MALVRIVEVFMSLIWHRLQNIFLRELIQLYISFGHLLTLKLIGPSSIYTSLYSGSTSDDIYESVVLRLIF